MLLSRNVVANIILEHHGLRARYRDPVSAMHAVIAVQTQYPASLGPALAARSNGVTAKWLTKTLRTDRAFLKGWTLRRTLHTSLAEDHMLLLAALKRRFIQQYQAWSMQAYRLSVKDLDQLHAQLLIALQKGPIGRRDLHEHVPFYKGKEWTGWGLDMKGLAFEGKVVLSHQAAARTEFALLETWAPHAKPHAFSEHEALKEIARRYFAAYGPATLGDFCYWTGLPLSHIKPAWNELLPELSEVEVKGAKQPLYLMSDKQGRADFNPPELKRLTNTHSPLRLLPKFDPLVMGHRDKTLFLDDHLKSRVFRPAGQIEATVLADLKLRGTWRNVRKGNALQFVIEPFEEFKQSWIDQLEKETRLAAKSLGFAAAQWQIA